MTRQFGMVRWFNDAKGFGYITPDQGGPDLFAHWPQIKGEGFKTLTEDQRVSFVVVDSPKGPIASEIEKEWKL